MASGDMAELVVGLGEPAGRQAIIDRLGPRLGAEQMLLFVRDVVVGAPVPAPGLRQTVRGGPTWRAFLAACRQEGRLEATVELPPGSECRALALIDRDTTVVLLGGAPDEAALAEFEAFMPLLSALLVAERDCALARAEAMAAAQSESHTQVIAAALEAARAEAAALNAKLRVEHDQKDLFLAMLGHELRNPLAPLVNSLEVIRLRLRERKEITQDMIDIMVRQTDQLSRLVEDLLDVSRVSRGRIKLRPEDISLQEIIDGALEVSRPLIDARSQTLERTEPDDAVYVHGDRARLVQVFGNLLNNAAKYSEPGSTITITISSEGDEATVAIGDSGIGISDEMLRRVFDLFSQATMAVDRAEGGLGIGLTLVRRLVELHGGSVVAESPGLNKGSTFTVTLPVAPAASRAAANVVAIQKRRTERSFRVLVVDDNRDAAASMAELLRLMGHQVTVAYDGHSPLALPEAANADVFFLDIGLPGKDGYELARALRPIAKPGARFFAISGYGPPKSHGGAAADGFDARVVKPATAETLRRLMSTVAAERATDAPPRPAGKSSPPGEAG